MYHPSLRLLCLLAALALLAGGCVFSDQPLSARADAKPDLRLAGTWLAQKDADSKGSTNPVEAARIHFDADGLGHLENLKNHGEEQGKPMPFFVTRTKQGSYLNLDTSDPAKDPKPAAGSDTAALAAVYMIVRYEVSDDGKTLKYSMLDRDRFKDALAAGKLKGRLMETEEKTTGGSSDQSPTAKTRMDQEIPLNDKEAIAKSDYYWVQLRDAPDNILKFIDSTPEKEIFDGPFTLKKVD